MGVHDGGAVRTAPFVAILPLCHRFVGVSSLDGGDLARPAGDDPWPHRFPDIHGGVPRMRTLLAQRQAPRAGGTVERRPRPVYNRRPLREESGGSTSRRNSAT